MARLLDHAEDAAIVAAALEGFRTEPIAGVRSRATVRIFGEIEALASPVIAPLSGVRCAAYDLLLRAHGDVAHRERSSTLFTIREPSGDRALVDVTHAQVRVRGRTLTAKRGDELTPAMEAWLARAGGEVAGWSRAEELTLSSGDVVVVVAAAMVELDRDDDRRIDSYRGLAPTRLRLGGTAAYPVMISTDPEDIEASRRHLADRW